MAIKPPRRSARLSGEKLPERDEIPPTCSPQTKKHFRFLDLPAEIRNRIYSFTFTQTPSFTLANLRTPPITIVSRLTRTESLPILFDECNFILDIAGNFLDGGGRQHAGVLGLQRGVSKILREAGNIVLFRHVTLRIFPTGGFRGAARNQLTLPTNVEQQLLAIIKLQAGPKAETNSFTVEYGSGYPVGRRLIWPGPKFYKAQVDETILRAKPRFEKLASRDGFKGLKLSDLDKIAKCFRFTLLGGKLVLEDAF